MMDLIMPPSKVMSLKNFYIMGKWYNVYFLKGGHEHLYIACQLCKN